MTSTEQFPPEIPSYYYEQRNSTGGGHHAGANAATTGQQPQNNFYSPTNQYSSHPENNHNPVCEIYFIYVNVLYFSKNLSKNTSFLFISFFSHWNCANYM